MELILSDEESADPGMKRLFKAILVSQLNRLLDVERMHTESDEANVPAGYLEALGPQVYWTLNLLMTRHLYVFSPYEVLHSAEAVVKEMHKDVPNRLSSPIDLHSLVLATLTLLEGTQLPPFSNFCWEVLAQVEEILNRREKATAEASEFENLFATPGWDSCLRAWIEDRRPHDQTNAATNANANATSGSAAPAPLVGPNEQRSLQHLADLAVGAEGTAAAGASSPSAAPGGDGAGGATTQLQAYVDFTLGLKRGYLRIIGKGPARR
jgi:hypothetical protein